MNGPEGGWVRQWDGVLKLEQLAVEVVGSVHAHQRAAVAGDGVVEVQPLGLVAENSWK